jgi:hypothetical protein
MRTRKLIVNDHSLIRKSCLVLRDKHEPRWESFQSCFSIGVPSFQIAQKPFTGNTIVVFQSVSLIIKMSYLNRKRHQKISFWRCHIHISLLFNSNL